MHVHDTPTTSMDSRATAMTSTIVAAVLAANVALVLGMLCLARTLVGPSPVLSACQAQVEERCLQRQGVSAASAAALESSVSDDEAVDNYRLQGRQRGRPQDHKPALQWIQNRRRRSLSTLSLQTIFENDSATGDGFSRQGGPHGFTDKVAQEVLEECDGDNDQVLATPAAL